MFTNPPALQPMSNSPSSGPAQGRHDYARYSRLSGQVTDPPKGAPATIAYRRLPGARPLRTIFGASIVMATQAALFVWVLLPSHWPVVT